MVVGLLSPNNHDQPARKGQLHVSIAWWFVSQLIGVANAYEVSIGDVMLELVGHDCDTPKYVGRGRPPIEGGMRAQLIGISFLAQACACHFWR